MKHYDVSQAAEYPESVETSLGFDSMKEALGEFEHHVLLAILRKGSRSYSVEIVKELEVRAGRGVGVTSIFVTLRRLEKKGLLTSEVVVPEQGHRRRYFALTSLAVGRLESAREAFRNLWEGVLPQGQ